MATNQDAVQHRKSMKRGFMGGHSKLTAPTAQTLYNAQDLHHRKTVGASAGQGFVPDWNVGSSLFSRQT
jgi:hypothetical protein